MSQAKNMGFEVLNTIVITNVSTLMKTTLLMRGIHLNYFRFINPLFDITAH